MPPVARALISLCLSAVLALATTSCGDDTQRIEWPAHTAPNSDAEALQAFPGHGWWGTSTFRHGSGINGGALQSLHDTTA